MPVKKKKRRKGRAPAKRPRVLESRERCTDSEQVKNTLEKFELDVGGFDYRTDVSVGPMKTESITKWSHVIAAMIKMPNCTQKCLSEALLAIAKEREKQWKLSSLKKSWSDKNAKMLRAMVRDVKGAISRRTTRGGHVADWLKPFMPDGASAPSTAAGASAPVVWKYGWDDDEQANCLAFSALTALDVIGVHWNYIGIHWNPLELHWNSLEINWNPFEIIS